MWNLFGKWQCSIRMHLFGEICSVRDTHPERTTATP
jgi:hypothetical protein